MTAQASMNHKPRMSQQEEEQHYFELFRKTYPLPGEVVYGDKPDVTVTGARRLGIEITNLYHDNGSSKSSETVQAKRRATVVSLAQSLYLKNGGKNISLKLGFDKSHPIEDAHSVAQNIAALARTIEDRENGQIKRHEFKHIPELDYLLARSLQYRDDYFDPEFPDGQPDPEAGFAAFALYRNRREVQALKEGNYKPLPPDAKWGIAQVHSHGLLSLKRLTEIVREKETKAQRYRPCDAYWLLVVVDWMDPAQEQEIRVDGLSIHSDVFERVIIYKPQFEHVVDILASNPGSEA
jgi:hypothetical protein